jgi:hypothetical protein
VRGAGRARAKANPDVFSGGCCERGGDLVCHYEISLEDQSDNGVCQDANSFNLALNQIP